MLQTAPFFVCGTIISTFEKKCATAPAQKCAEQNVLEHFQHSTFLCCTKMYSTKKCCAEKTAPLSAQRCDTTVVSL